MALGAAMNFNRRSIRQRPLAFAAAACSALTSVPAFASGGDAAPVSPWVSLAYLVAGVFFILALRGLSSPETSRDGNRFGMIGMGIAVITTLITHDIANIVEIIAAIAIGGVAGFVIARKIKMTDMPQLVA
ncbi:MAG: NAD(P)(+) transhydrogenase (Re/Si-specific) subunit beta, partial [Blastomonas fulva]